jgi:chromosome segregation ATPase
LREQIRNTERTDHRKNAPQERAERSNEREIELQNQLLDVQENYGTLSQRHAKLIADMSRSRDADVASSANDLEENAGASAVERLKRSNSFAEAVEKVVLEYEKTIQTLEASLSSTRGSLSATESSLLEKETKLAYVETVNQQLQTRVQKMMDREASTESYLHDLEAKLDGHTSGGEKNAAIIVELRKEIIRVRESEASCEDYISTLEERLAESEQDAEMMQREIERLEHVIDRQRSLGKLDNLLYELDHIAKDDKGEDYHSAAGESLTGTNGHSKQMSLDHIEEAEVGDDFGADGIAEVDERSPSQLSKELGNDKEDAMSFKSTKSHRSGDSKASLKVPGEDYPPQSPAQTKFVAEKLENVTQELFDLRVEHESTVGELDLVSAKYEEALRTLAELQDAVDEARHTSTGTRDSRDYRDSITSPASTRPTSFLEDPRVNGLKDGSNLLSSRSLSSELSLAGESPVTHDISDREAAFAKTRGLLEEQEAHQAKKGEMLAVELENLKQLQSEKEESLRGLTEQYSQLEVQHHETLDLVEELKAEVTKAKMGTQVSPSSVIRRKSSQNVMVIDRAHRSFAALRNLATDNLESNPDAMASFEVNLNGAMHELHSRSERIQELEAEIAGVKKEMETKSSIISGLTRERSSIQKSASPMDISVVSSMRDQLLQSENQIKVLQETHQAREQELLDEVKKLQAGVEEHLNTGAKELSGEAVDPEKEQRIKDLEGELSQLGDRHTAALDSMKASEQKMMETIQGLEASLQEIENLHAERADTTAQQHSKTLADHQATVDGLNKQMEDHQSTICTHIAQIAALETTHTAALDEHNKSRELTEGELNNHRDLVSKLEQQISEHQTAIDSHHESLKDLQDSHANELESLKSSMQQESEARIAEQAVQHDAQIAAIQAELQESREALAAHVEKFDKLEVTSHEYDSIIEKLHGEKKTLEEQTNHSEQIAKALQVEAETHKATADQHLLTLTELKTTHATKLAELEKLSKKEEKNSRIVEELEQELSNTFEQHQAAANRVSMLQTERNSALQEAQITVETLREEVSALQVCYFPLLLPYYLMLTSRNSLSCLRMTPNFPAMDVQTPSQVRLPFASLYHLLRFLHHHLLFLFLHFPALYLLFHP